MIGRQSFPPDLIGKQWCCGLSETTSTAGIRRAPFDNVDVVFRFRAARSETELRKDAPSGLLPILSAGLPGKDKPEFRSSFGTILVFLVLAGLWISALTAVSWSQTNGAAETDPQVAGSISGQITLTGHVQDKHLAGLSVTLTGPEPEISTRTALSDEHGFYQFNGLIAGRYRLDVTSNDFQPSTNLVALGEKQAMTENISLRLNEISEKIDVSASSPDVSTQGSESTSTFADRQLETLPLAERACHFSFRGIVSF